jgi:hypothetical protein
MQDHTPTLRIGSHAPDFSLPAANREGRFALSQILLRSAAVIEFLRGTW